MYAFDLKIASSVADATEALKDDTTQALGGGQTLIPTLRARLAMPETLVVLNQIPEMRGICRGKDGSLCIGAATTHAEVAKSSETFSGLASMADRIGDPAVRNRGTIGGSLANNDPSACYPAAVLGTGARIVTNAREIDADDYFQGMFTTALEEGEIIIEVRFPVPEASNYQKFVQPASRFALVGVFVAKFPGGVRVAVTGASEDGVFRWSEAEEALTETFQADALSTLTVDESHMIEDLHASRDYRAHLVKVMTSRAVAAAS